MKNIQEDIAVRFARLPKERQQAFRIWLFLTLTGGTLFMGIQTYGLWCLFPTRRTPADATVGVTPFVMVFATLHALHVFVAQMFAAFVAARAWADRYDHEYYWGVSICAWFWHVLGIVWLAILAVFAISLG